MAWNGKKIKKLRKARGETQQEFADSIRASLGAVRFWEQDMGRPRGPVEALLDLLAEKQYANGNGKVAV